MKTNKIRNWLKTWDEGEFEFAINEDVVQPTTTDNAQSQNLEHPWKTRHVDKIEQKEINIFKKLYPFISTFLCLVIVGFLILTVIDLPTFGSANAPAHNEVMDRYIESGMDETGAVNVVAGVILDYRAFDTLGESHVLFTASIAVFILLLSIIDENEPSLEKEITQKDSLLRSTAFIVVPLVLIYGIYVVLGGHIGPGGGFAGGAVIGGGLILYALSYGFDTLDRILNLKNYRIIITTALCFYSIAKCYSFFCGANHLETIFTTGTPGMIFSAGLILPLNIAVGVVVALTMYGFYSIFQRGRIG